ncbi:MAG: HAMP domain-containing histidine kinase [Defluviitaleaceae bacterium]|nr:HAMP domain-containing histidine kinase [Defluviitaleaceae bacterium]
MKRLGIFFKVFSYTAFFLLVIISVTVIVFSQQFLSFYNTTQTQQLYASYQALHEQLVGRSNDEVIQVVEEFFAYNQSFIFYILDNNGRVVFTTPNAAAAGNISVGEHRIRMTVGSDHTLFAINRAASQVNYGGLIRRSLFALGCMLAIGMSGAFIFARQMTNPIKNLADDTKKMASLQDVPPRQNRSDEIGSLTQDVHFMYEKLKETISSLEDEISRVREMEEAQRYFFAAASHELKTPIAAASILLEGMIENIGDYKDHPKYLMECVKLMDSQNKIISEIFELVNLHDQKIIPIAVMPENQPEVSRIFGARQGSADDAGQEGPLGGTDAGLCQKDRHIGLVFGYHGYNPKKIDISETVMSVMPNHQTLAEAKGQLININIPGGHYCVADREMLKKVLSNVILNAVQNTPHGGEICIFSEAVAGLCRVSVLNKGVVIEEGVLPRLFDPFFRMDKARNRKDGRSGLGLTIVQKTLGVMGADFGLEQTGDGVLFWVELPVTPL